MLEKYFFDSSAFIEILREQSRSVAVERLLDSLKRSQKFTSVLVAYELYRGIPLSYSRRKSQTQALNEILADFTLKPVHEAVAMHAAKLHRFSKGDIDPVLAAQCIDGGYTLVTVNEKDFVRVPGIRLAKL